MTDQDSNVTQMIAGDLLYGVPACAEFLGCTERQARHRFEKGQLPSFRIGESICARKSSLTAALDQMEREAVASG